MDVGGAGHEQIDEFVFEWSSATDVGRVRSLNEDSMLVEPGLFVVADGMGGHAAGDVASALAIEVFRERAESIPLSLDVVEELIAAANRRVRERAEQDHTDGMGTTLVGVALVQNGDSRSLLVFNVGDSRCYSWNPTEGLSLVTRDHSLVQELVDAGDISADEMNTHPERNVVTRAIGVEPSVAPDFVVLPQAPHRRLLLCSDGVSGQVEASTIDAAMAREHAASTAAVELVERVLDGPAPDNATCVAVDVAWTDARSPGLADADVTGPRPAPLDDVTGPPPGAAPRESALIRSVPGVGGAPDSNGSLLSLRDSVIDEVPS